MPEAPQTTEPETGTAPVPAGSFTPPAEPKRGRWKPACAVTLIVLLALGAILVWGVIDRVTTKMRRRTREEAIVNQLERREAEILYKRDFDFQARPEMLPTAARNLFFIDRGKRRQSDPERLFEDEAVFLVSGVRLRGREIPDLHFAPRAVSDEELDLVKKLSELRYLEIRGVELADDHLRRVGELTDLLGLSLRECVFSSQNYDFPASLSRLQLLDLADTTATDSTLAGLPSMSGLRWLDLSGTTVTDAGLVPLRGLSALEELDLSRTGITDAGLPNLYGLKALRRLDLMETAVTQSGHDQLRAALPNCEIYWNNSSENDSFQ